MKVLHLSPGRFSGGIDTMLVTLARERAACPALEPSFAVCFDQGRLARELRETGAPVFSLGPVQVRFPWQILRARARLRRLLAAERFDVAVVHSSWMHALFGGLARERGLPVVFWMHNKATPAGMNFMERRAGRLRPDLIVCNSRFTAGTIPVLFGPSPPPSRVIHCPVTPPPASLRDQRAAVRAELATPGDDTVIIQVGWLEPTKGHALHLAALARLKDVPGWTCWIVGGVETARQAGYLRELQALTARYGIAGRVRFLGHRRDVSQLLAAADIFCQPNLDAEAFGIVFVEALYAGLPVVSARHGGVLEIVDETCGRLVAPGDTGALANTLGALLADRALRAGLSDAAPRRAAEVSAPAGILHEMHEAFAALESQPNH